MTLVELLIVVAVIAVLSGAAISLLTTGHSQIAAEDAARRVAADLAFAQADAIAKRSERLVIFDAATDAYGIYSGGAPLTHPVSKKPFLVDFGDLFHGVEVDLRVPGFGGSDTLRFDVEGIPACGGTVGLQAGGSDWEVTVADVTGHVSVLQIEVTQ